MRIIVSLVLASLLAATAAAQQTEARLEELEGQLSKLRATLAAASAAAADLAELERRLAVLAEEVERLRLGAAAPAPAGEEGRWGLAPAASKVYTAAPGVSLGGYGEMVYEDPSGRREDDSASGRPAQVDFLRAVVYLGYKFDERFVLNTEIEFEHGTTSGSVGEVSVEFAYLDYLWRPELNLGAGMVLLPVGLINELHEPAVFHGALRPALERTVIPSTWRENGVGVFGEVGPVAYRAYLVNGLDASKFSAAGWRGGRQKGARARAEDFAWVARVDYVGVPGLVVGGSIYTGGAGQDRPAFVAAGANPETTLIEAHFDWRWRALALRALAVRANLSDAAAVNAALNLAGAASVGSRLSGHYLEASWDVLPGRAALEPFLRWEQLNTQERVPAGFAANPANDTRILTLGASFRPIPQIVVKLDWQDVHTRAHSGVNAINVGVGYVFKKKIMLAVVLGAASAAAGAQAGVLLSLDEALSLIFPGAEVRRQPVFLTEAQRQEIRRLAGSPPASAMVMRYEAHHDGSLVGVAYTDTHRVRTLPATLLVALDAADKVLRVEVLSFDEPLEYVPRPEWYARLAGRRLDGELALKRGVPPVAGATLTASATVEAVRRVLALHAVVGHARR